MKGGKQMNEKVEMTKKTIHWLDFLFVDVSDDYSINRESNS